jgi:hypothetical protein
MKDNWGFVFAAYAFAVIVLGGYWRRLVRLERELEEASHRPRQGRRA